jgi:hypothetical protein
VFLSSCPPIAWVRSTSSIPTYNGCQYTGRCRENKPSLLLIEQELVEVVSESDGRERPGSIEAGTIGVAPANSVRTDQSDNLLVVEAAEA